jgi:hypothetical protein
MPTRRAYRRYRWVIVSGFHGVRPTGSGENANALARSGLSGPQPGPLYRTLLFDLWFLARATIGIGPTTYALRICLMRCSRIQNPCLHQVPGVLLMTITGC